MVIDIGSVLAQWESVGIFDFLLPFLLMFAIIFGVLSATNIIGKNRGVHLVIAFAIGLMALRLDFVNNFFREVFPRLGVGLAVVIVAMILVGLFIPHEQAKYWYWVLGGLGGVVALFVVSSTFNILGYDLAEWGDWTAWIVGGILLVVLIIAVVASTSKDDSTGKVTFKPFRE